MINIQLNNFLRDIIIIIFFLRKNVEKSNLSKLTTKLNLPTFKMRLGHISSLPHSPTNPFSKRLDRRPLLLPQRHT